MSYFFKLSFAAAIVFYLNACGGGSGSSSSADVELPVEELITQENLNAINPLVLPLVVEVPAVALKQ